MALCSSSVTLGVAAACAPSRARQAGAPMPAVSVRASSRAAAPLSARRAAAAAPLRVSAPAAGVRRSAGRSARGGATVAAAGVVTVTEATFEAEVLKSPIPVLVDFWATWCGPCKLISVVVGQVAGVFGDKLKVVKIETDPNPALVEKYAVYGLPTVMVFKGGQALEGSKKEGAITKVKLLEHLAGFGITP